MRLTRARGTEKSVAHSASSATPSAATSTRITCSPAGSSTTPDSRAPRTWTAVPDTRPDLNSRSASSATPAVISPVPSPSSSAGSSTTRVASAVLATGPGARARAASLTMAHRSATEPPAPPASSATATPNRPSSASPSNTGFQASGVPCSISRMAAAAAAPAAQVRTSSRAANSSSVIVADTGGSSGFEGVAGPEAPSTRTCSNSASHGPSSSKRASTGERGGHWDVVAGDVVTGFGFTPA